MTERFNFKINSRVRIFITKNGLLVSYLSIIQDVQETMIGVDVPIDKGMYVSLSENQELTVHVFDVSGLYEFNTKVVKIVKNNLPILYLSKSSHVKKYENRQFTRLKTYLPIEYSINTLEGFTIAKNIPLKGNIYSRDISVGGGCLIMPFDLPKGLILDLNIEVPRIALHTYVILKVQAEVCRVQKDNFSDDFFVSIAFTRIYEEDRAIIDKYVNDSLGIG